MVRERGSRTDQGDYESIPDDGPWFAARLMERGGPASKVRRRENSTDAKVPRGYELLVAPKDENGDAVVITTGAVVQTECPVLGSPTIELSTAPEVLTNGRRLIGYFAFAVKTKDSP